MKTTLFRTLFDVEQLATGSTVIDDWPIDGGIFLLLQYIVFVRVYHSDVADRKDSQYL